MVKLVFQLGYDANFNQYLFTYNINLKWSLTNKT
jgi:hypothetical protein